MNTSRLCIFTLLVSVAAATASADQAVLTPTHDNTIFSESSSLSAGGQNGVFAGSNNMPGFPSRRGLMQFDLSSIPAGAAITGASLTLTLEQGGNTSSPTVELHRLNVAWGEGTAGSGGLSGAGSAAATGDATWTEPMHNQTTWPAGGDFVSTASASQTVSGNTTGSTFTWSSAGLLADVQTWFANPSTNHGWELINLAEGSAQSVKVFYSKEFSDASRQPHLTVTFVPEPASVALALIAVTLGTCFRRR